MNESMHDLETTMFTAVSVAMESLEAMIDQVPAGVAGSVRLGYVKAATADARRELDLFLEDRDPARMTKLNRLVTEANARLSELSS